MKRKEEIIQAAREKEKEVGFTQIVQQARGVNSAYGIGFLEGCEWADSHPNASWAERLKLEREKWLDNAAEWLSKNKHRYVFNARGMSYEDTIPVCSNKLVEDFREAMER